jgi:hypothetical protein
MVLCVCSYTCGGVGHMSRDCVQGSKCYNCSGVGHISRDCPQPQRRACYTCGSEGYVRSFRLARSGLDADTVYSSHISRDCPGVGVGSTDDTTPAV